MPGVTYVEYSGAREHAEVAVGESVMRGAQANDVVGIIGECGGGLSCATCHCYVDEAWTAMVGGPASQVEVELLASAAAEVRPTSRLSCQIEMTAALDGLIVHLPQTQY